VVAVGVQTAFLPVGGLAYCFLQLKEQRTKTKDCPKPIEGPKARKAMCQLCEDCKKCDRKKQQQGGLRGGRQKDCASPEVQGARIFACRGFVLRSCP